MTPEQSQRVLKLVTGALQTPPPERLKWLASQDEPDAEVKAEATRLLGSETQYSGARTMTMPGGGVEAVAWHGELEPGNLLAGRYEIRRLLGRGGMGAVYQAHDREEQTEVAIKVIRMEAASTEAARERLRREVRLAKSITHPSVVRIHHLEVTPETLFFTMDWVDGQALSDYIAGRPEPDIREAARIWLQIAEGLAAAHEAGVVHRDLKPQNVLLDRNGRAKVLDFGIARSDGAAGDVTLTQTGALIGTPFYMAPEQMKGERADARSDIYSLGLIAYELLTGRPPYPLNSPLATLMRRLQEAPPDPLTINPDVPGPLGATLTKCLAPSPGDRPASAAELAQELREWLEGRPRREAGQAPRWRALAGGVVLLALIAGGTALWKLRTPAAPERTKAVSLLLTDFDNQTGEPRLSGTLEPAVGLLLEDAPFITLLPRQQAMDAASKLRAGVTSLDEKTGMLVAAREGVGAVLRGVMSKEGSRYKLRLAALDGDGGKVIGEAAEEAGTAGELLKAAPRAVAAIRRALGDQTPEAEQLRRAETFSASNLDAAAAYARGQQAQLLGRWDDAIREYNEAVKADPKMGRAYAGLAVCYRNANQSEEAVTQYEKALANLDRMTPRERYRTRGGYFVTTRNEQQALGEYQRLVKEFPADTAGHANLALVHLLLRHPQEALGEARQAVDLYPRNLMHRNNLALFALYAGKFDEAAARAEEVLKPDPKFVKAYLAIALANAAKGKADEARRQYEKMREISPRGASLASYGLADLALSEENAGAAVDLLKEGIAADEQRKAGSAAAYKKALLAEAYASGGQGSLAAGAARSALTESADDAVQYLAARVLLGTAQRGEASRTVKSLEKKVGITPRTHARLLQAETHLVEGRALEALDVIAASQKEMDTWLGHWLSGRAYLALGKAAESSAAYERCLERAGEAIAVMIDDTPSVRLLMQARREAERTEQRLKQPAGR